MERPSEVDHIPRVMAEEPRKRSRFDQTETEPRKGSRFDRTSRSPSNKRSDDVRSRSPGPNSMSSGGAEKQAGNAAAAAAAAAAKINALIQAKKSAQSVEPPAVVSVSCLRLRSYRMKQMTNVASHRL